jgi:hypothetical protein
MEFRASEGRGFQPRPTDARNLTCCKWWNAICGGAEAPPLEFLHFWRLRFGVGT